MLTDVPFTTSLPPAWRLLLHSPGLSARTYLILFSVNTAFRHIPAGISIFDAELPLVAVAGVAGAYMWVLHDLILRERSLDLPTTHVNRATFRFVVAIGLGYALAA